MLILQLQDVPASSLNSVNVRMWISKRRTAANDWQEETSLGSLFQRLLAAIWNTRSRIGRRTPATVERRTWIKMISVIIVLYITSHSCQNSLKEQLNYGQVLFSIISITAIYYDISIALHGKKIIAVTPRRYRSMYNTIKYNILLLTIVDMSQLSLKIHTCSNTH